ncbi:MAG TPA: histidine kinase [Longimicrobiales bacterium]|nr:histidine kinase [Longimicrobiales bacterium]
MNESVLNQRRVWIAGFAIWTLLALLGALQNISTNRAFAPNISLDYSWIFVRSFWSWYSCALFTPWIIWLTRRFRFERQHLARNIVIHLAGFVAFLFVKANIFVYVGHSARLISQNFTAKQEFIADAFSLLIMYWTVVAVWYAWEYYNRFRERELSASRLETQLMQVRLEALRAQLHPHFLFNALNALSTLIHKDANAADEMVIRIGDLLRQTLDANAPQEVPLREELETLERYLAIMRIRLGERLQVSVDVDAAAADVMVPNMILQPLVENALRHGIGQKTDSGKLVIRGHIVAEELELEVVDDGAGPPRDLVEGVGLTNTRERLAQLYNGRHTLEIMPITPRGTSVRVTIPCAR